MTKYTDREKLHTFSIGFDGKYDETPYINIVKNHFHTNHHHYYFTREDCFAQLINYQRIYDEPLADFGYLPGLKISELAKKHITVTLTGDGGDEIFGGYTSYPNLYILQNIRRIPRIIRKVLLHIINLVKKQSDLTALGKIRELVRWSLTPNDDSIIYDLYPGSKYLNTAGKKFYKEKKQQFLKKGADIVEAERAYNLFYSTLADNFLTKIDRASMLYGLEARSPFLDYRFLEYSFRIPTRYKVNSLKTKKILREIVKGIVPKQVLNLRKK
jgi:asparagine synthase (glutamine-hydrolysing)